MRFAPIVLLLCAAFADAQTPTLTASDVQNVIQSAAKSVSAGMSIAVTDRQGNILGVFQTPGAPAMSTGNFGVSVDTNDLAAALARILPTLEIDYAVADDRAEWVTEDRFPEALRREVVAPADNSPKLEDPAAWSAPVRGAKTADAAAPADHLLNYAEAPIDEPTLPTAHVADVRPAPVGNA